MVLWITQQETLLLPGGRKQCPSDSAKTPFYPIYSTRDMVGLHHFYFRIQFLVIFVFLTFFCSWKIPYRSASAVGGHPGT